MTGGQAPQAPAVSPETGSWSSEKELRIYAENLASHSLVCLFSFYCPGMFSKVLFECFKLFSAGSQGTEKLKLKLLGDTIQVRLLGWQQSCQEHAFPHLPNQLWSHEHWSSCYSAPLGPCLQGTVVCASQLRRQA